MFHFNLIRRSVDDAYRGAYHAYVLRRVETWNGEWYFYDLAHDDYTVLWTNKKSKATTFSSEKEAEDFMVAFLGGRKCDIVQY
jgi:hypothetical protein